MNEEAQRHLLRLLDLAREGPPGPVHHNDWMRESLSRFGATLEAMRAVGTIIDDESHDWNNRFLVTLGIEPLEPLSPGSRGPRAKDSARVADALTAAHQSRQPILKYLRRTA